MALNLSDDEDIDFQRQRFQHPDDADDMDMNSDSDGDAEQVISTPYSVNLMWFCSVCIPLPWQASACSELIEKLRAEVCIVHPG